jgi:hypothetical protein
MLGIVDGTGSCCPALNPLPTEPAGPSIVDQNSASVWMPISTTSSCRRLDNLQTERKSHSMKEQSKGSLGSQSPDSRPTRPESREHKRTPASHSRQQNLHVQKSALGRVRPSEYPPLIRHQFQCPLLFRFGPPRSPLGCSFDRLACCRRCRFGWS